MSDPEGKARPRRTRSRRGPSWLEGRRGWLVVYLMVVYGVALVVVTLAMWYLLVAPSTTPSSSPPAPVPCTLGSLPAATTGPNATIAATTTAHPSPLNGTRTPETFELWVNTTGRLFPGTNLSFAVHDLPGVPATPSCLLPVASSGWTNNASGLSVDPQHSYLVAFTGAPVGGYSRSGAFALETWVNATNAPESLGSTLVFLTVT